MKKTAVRHTALIFGALMYLLTGIGPGAAYGFVWCFGEDGHSELEFVAGSSCATDREDDSGLNSLLPGCGMEAADEHCGPCRDIPASYTSIQSRSRSIQAAAVTAVSPAPVITPSFPVFLKTIQTNLYPQPPPRPNPLLASIRSVVLLN